MKINKIILLSSLSIFFLSIIISFLFYSGILRFNYVSISKYPIQGLDISHHQGKINWSELDSSYRFIFIKATEGGDFVDPLFKENIRNAKKYGFVTGAYHFFTFRKSGKEQADHFLLLVSEEPVDLPPVIDLEYMGNSNIKSSKENLHQELEIFINEIDIYFKRKPILYTTYEFYNKYLSDCFLDCDIWIRDIVKSPKFNDNRNWLFWQYSNRGKVKGINGFVDLNAFNGSDQIFSDLTN